MGNYNFRVSRPPVSGSVVTIRDDQFSKDQEIPTDILKRGQPVKVVKTTNLYQSRKEGNPITICTVKFQNGQTEAYLAANLK